MNIESHFDYDSLRAIEDTRAALRTLSVMTGALMERGDSLKSYSMGFEVLLDAQVDKLKEAEDMIRASFRNIKQASVQARSDTMSNSAGREQDADLSEEQAREIEANLKLKAGTVQRVIDQLQTKQVNGPENQERIA